MSGSVRDPSSSFRTEIWYLIYCNLTLCGPVVRPAVAFALPQVGQAMRMGCPFSSVTADSCEYRRPDCYHLVLLRHGESEWNAAKRFTGWVDVDLTEKGRIQVTRPDTVGILILRARPKLHSCELRAAGSHTCLPRICNRQCGPGAR